MDKKSINKFMIILVAGLLTELLIFNFRTFEVLFARQISYPVEQLDVQDMNALGDGYYQITGEDNAGIIYIWKLDELMGDVSLMNIKLDIELPQAVDDPYRESGVLKLEPFIRDEGHDRYFGLEGRVYRPDVSDSRYLWLKSAGKIKTLTLKLIPSEGNVIQIKGITVNAGRPLQVSFARLILIYAVLALIYVLRRDSWIWKGEASWKKRMLAAVAVGAGLLLPAIIMDAANGKIWTEKSFQPYQKLAEAFAAGQLSYLEIPPQEFSLMDDPYDHGARDAMGLDMDTDYLWDTAYYEGKYYCYFGVVPCVLFYLPVYLICGRHLHDTVLTLMLAAFIYAGLYMLVKEWIRRNRPETPYAYIILITVMTFLGSGLPVVLSDPNAHDVPRVAGLAFVIWGLYLWLSSMKTDRKGLIPGRLATGSLLMALAVGCRPNQALVSFAAIPMFYQYLKLEEGYGKKERSRGIMALMLPYVPVAIALMAYNALRFGSIFDFGYAYNLTVLDYTQPNISLDRIVIGFFEYLFRMPAVSYHFPYIKELGFLQFNRLGHGNFYYTSNYGGLVTTNLLIWCILGMLCGDKKYKDGRWLLGLGLIDLVINSCVAGVAYHYRLDFAFLFLMSGATGAAALADRLKDSKVRIWLRRFIIMAFVLSVLYHGCFYVSSSLRSGNSQLYYALMNSCI